MCDNMTFRLWEERAVGCVCVCSDLLLLISRGIIQWWWHIASEGKGSSFRAGRWRWKNTSLSLSQWLSAC